MATEENNDLARSWQVYVTEENKALARRAWEAVDNPDLIDEVYASDVVWHEPDRDIHGTQEAKQFVSLYKTAFPGLSITVEDVIAEGDKVVTRVTLRGTHQRSEERRAGKACRSRWSPYQ